MDDLRDIIAKRPRRPKPDGHLHSEAHLLADEISKAFGEPKRFGMYLGVIKRVGVDQARRIFRKLQLETKEGHPGKLFMYLCRKEPPKDGEPAPEASGEKPPQ